MAITTSVSEALRLNSLISDRQSLAIDALMSAFEGDKARPYLAEAILEATDWPDPDMPPDPDRLSRSGETIVACEKIARGG